MYILSTSGPDYVTRVYRQHPEMHKSVTVIHDWMALPPDGDKFKFGVFGEHHSSGTWRDDAATGQSDGRHVASGGRFATWWCNPDPMVIAGQMLSRIPRRTFQVVSSLNPSRSTLDWMAGVQRLHPMWEYVRVSGSEEAYRFIAETKPELLPAFSAATGTIASQQFDLVKLAAVYVYGGFYLDADVELHRPLDALLNETAVFPHEEYIHTTICQQHQVYGRWPGVDCSRWFQQIGAYGFGAISGHPFVRALLDGLVHELSTGTTSRTYPKMYLHTTSGSDYVTRVFRQYSDIIGNNVSIIHDWLSLPPDRDKFKFGIYGKHHMVE